MIRRPNPLKPSEKAHAHRTGRTFFRWCVGQHIIDRSPMETVARPPTGKPRERVLSEEELKAVYSTSSQAQNGFQRLVCLLIHTGCRRGELTQLQWVHVAPDTVTLPAEITKNKRNHAFPIGPGTQTLIASFPRFAGTPYVFPAFKGKPTTVMVGYSEAKRDCDAECASRNSPNGWVGFWIEPAGIRTNAARCRPFSPIEREAQPCSAASSTNRAASRPSSHSHARAAARSQVGVWSSRSGIGAPGSIVAIRR
jgi:hypothetical protein